MVVLAGPLGTPHASIYILFVVDIFCCCCDLSLCCPWLSLCVSIYIYSSFFSISISPYVW